MNCAWCQRSTDDQYIVKKTKKALSGTVLPLCREHASMMLGEHALPLQKKNDRLQQNRETEAF